MKRGRSTSQRRQALMVAGVLFLSLLVFGALIADPGAVASRDANVSPFASPLGIAAFTGIVVGLLGGIGFALSIHRMLRSLEELTDAADRIGSGDLTPWLPFPDGQEAGRLSLAIGSMAERLRDMMRQVNRSGRLAVVGELATYLSHEIRNPLSSIQLNMQILQRKLGDLDAPPDAGHALSICLTEIRRLDAAVSGVLKLGKPQPTEARLCQLHDVVYEAVELMRPEFTRRGIAIHASLHAWSDSVMADEQELRAAFLNLFLNAAEAMDGGGRLTVTSESVHDENGGEAILLVLSDTGPGIPVELQDHVFDLFFTTKKEGSGIGLALAQRTVEDAGGSIELGTPFQHVGATFVIELPVVSVGGEGSPSRRPAETGWSRRDQLRVPLVAQGPAGPDLGPTPRMGE